MTRKFLLLAFIALSQSIMAIETNDFLTLTPRSGKTLNPGSNDETFYVTVALSGSTIYSWLQADIVLPEGVEPVLSSEKPKVLLRTVEDGMFPATETITGYDDDDEPIYSKTYTSHSIQSAFHILENGHRVIRVGITNTDMANFAKTTGELFRFYVKASTFAKPQTDAIYLENVELITNTAEGYEPKTVARGVEVTSSATASVNISATNQWSTCILPFDATIPTGISAYTTSARTTIEDNDYLVLSKVESMSAYAPYILYCEDGYSGTIDGTVDDNDYPSDGYVTSGYLNGAVVPQQITEGYVLQNLSSGVKFYNTGGESFTIPAGKCWVTIPASAVKAVGFATDDATGIYSISEKSSTDEIYDLNGHKVSNSQTKMNNIYIINGQKVLKIK